MLQGGKLTMIGLGIHASPVLDAGIHLRWNFDASLSFPKFGFDIYRRKSDAVKCSPTCIDFLKIVLMKAGTMFTFGSMTFASTKKVAVRAGSKGGNAIVPASGAVYVFKNSKKMREFDISEYHASGTLTIRAYDGTVPVATVTQAATRTKTSVKIRADRFDRVELRAAPGVKIELYGICWFLTTDCADSDDWKKLANFRLPEAWAQAKDRIPSSVYPIYQTPYPRLAEVIKMVTTGAIGETTLYQTNPTNGDTPAGFRFYPVKLLLFASADPYVARMLGLYYIDTDLAPDPDPVAGTSYDYKVVGNWAARESAEHAWICWRLSRGAPPPVAKPTGLATAQRQLIGGVAGEPASQIGVGLTWDIARTARGLSPNAPIMYHVSRRMKHGGTWSAPVAITERSPVIVASNADVMPDWYYTDGPLALGAYRYAVRAVDIWGRHSLSSAVSAVTLVDDMPPPPPAQVAVNPSFQDGPTGEVTVTWTWPQASSDQAGDAQEFRVFHQGAGIDPEAGVISSVTDNGDGTSTLVTDLNGSHSDYDGGDLINGGRRFKVVACTGTSPVKIKVTNIIEENEDMTTTTVTPTAAGVAGSGGRDYLVFETAPWAAKGKFLLSKDWSDAGNWDPAYETVAVASVGNYSQLLTGIDFGTSAAATMGKVMFAVCTVDATGNVGPLSPPAIAAARHKETIAAPGAPAGQTYATRADFYGNSYCDLALASADTTKIYDVYRALDATVVSAAAVAADLEDILDEDLKDYADDNEAAFTRVGSMTLSGTDAAYRDTLKGTGRNRFLYKLKAVDAAGNASDFSDAVLVKLHDVTPPKAPVIVKVKGEEKQITVQWAANKDNGLTGYELYRTGDAAKANDHRSMDLVKEADTATLEYLDADVTARTPYYYALLAIRVTEEDATLKSAMSKALSAQAYDLTVPDAPEFDDEDSGWVSIDDGGTVYEWDEDTSSATNPRPAIRLVWNTPENRSVVAITKRASEDNAWSEMRGWMTGEIYAEGKCFLIDDEVTDDDSYMYGIRSRSEAGLISSDSGMITIDSVA